MFCYVLERSPYIILCCDGFSMIYGVPAILSMQFSTMLMITDSIVPCVINKNKVVNKPI